MVSIDTILQSTRFPASGEIAHSLIIAVSAMCQTKSLVTYVSRSTESGHSAGHRVVRVHHRIVRSGFAVVSMDVSPTHEYQRAHRADGGRAGGDQRRPVTAQRSPRGVTRPQFTA